MMSDAILDDGYTAQRTESMDQLATFLKAVLDDARQVDDALDDLTSRASQLDAISTDLLDAIDHSSRHCATSAFSRA